MSWQRDLAGEDKELREALEHFKTSMDAWSDAALHRPRTGARTTVRHSWRLAAGWALGCLLTLGGLAGAVHQAAHNRDLARMAAQKAAEERAAADRAAAQPESTQVEKPARETTANNAANREDESLLANVDSDVSRGVPAAMEPLAQLMDENGSE